MMIPKVLESTLLAAGRFLRLELLSYRDAAGRNRKWETVQRANMTDAVAMIATVKQTGEVLLVKQFRPPVNTYTIEFPAGLIDPGESAAETAVRELKEETGYLGTVDWIAPPAASSAGLTGEKISNAYVTVDLEQPENQHPETDFQGGEDIEIFRMIPSELPEFFAEQLSAGAILDSRVTTWAAAQGLKWMQAE